ncbi:MAG: flippase-like domain-containing protein [Phycisphaerales bacterium]|nr:flippase-like domain-containing protein [Phycisphaerales bacterium]
MSDAGARDSAVTSAPGGRPRRRIHRAMHIAGFLIGLAMLGWCVRMALHEREAFARLGEASPRAVLLLLVLSAASIGINGIIFWVVLRPARRLDVPGVLATNALATLLNYLPFKLSLLSRVLVHVRRDRLDLFTIGAWFAACAVLMLSAPAPLLAVAWFRRSVDAGSIALAGALTAVAGAFVVLGARCFAGERGEVRFTRLVRRVPGARRAAGSAALARLHAGFTMLASAPAVAGAMALRLGDLLVQAARFVVAAGILGIPLDWSQALPLALAYFMIGVLTPVGALGAREGGVVGLAILLGAGERESIAALALLVTGTEAIANLACGGVGLAYLRPWRWFGGRNEADSARRADDEASAPGE